MKGQQRRLKLRMLNGVQRLIKNREGQDMAEYALVLALIALAVVATMKGLAVDINNLIADIGATPIGAV